MVSIRVFVKMMSKKKKPGMLRPKSVTRVFKFKAKHKPFVIDLWANMRDYMLCAAPTDQLPIADDMSLLELDNKKIYALPWTGQAAAARTAMLDAWGQITRVAIENEIEKLEERLAAAKRSQAGLDSSADF